MVCGISVIGSSSSSFHLVRSACNTLSQRRDSVLPTPIVSLYRGFHIKVSYTTLSYRGDDIWPCLCVCVCVCWVGLLIYARHYSTLFSVVLWCCIIPAGCVASPAFLTKIAGLRLVDSRPIASRRSRSFNTRLPALIFEVGTVAVRVSISQSAYVCIVYMYPSQ